MIKLFCLLAITICCKFSFAQTQINVVPYPNGVIMDKGYFELSAATNIIYGKGTEKLVKYFTGQVKNLTGLSLKSQLQNDQQKLFDKNIIHFFLKEDASLTDGYSLLVSK